MSIWFPSANNKPLIIFGHDNKCIFKQYLLMKKSWIGPNGKNMLVPKDEGQGIMLSALQSHEFSFGLELNPEELAKDNNERKGQKYKDEKAATKKRGSIEKEDLHESPFVREFEYGASYEGYWYYEHIVLQLEDCCNVFHVLYTPFDFLFLFDHSCGHGKQ